MKFTAIILSTVLVPLLTNAKTAPAPDLVIEKTTQSSSDF